MSAAFLRGAWNKEAGREPNGCLISVGIIGFGGWIVANSKVESGLFPIWFVLGLLTIAVGLMSLLREIREVAGSR